MKSEVLNLGKHFLTIDSTIPFELYNPITQTIINKASGRWVVDCWKLLTKEYFKNNPQFVLELRYDENLLVGKNKIEWHVTDIDIGSIQSEYQLVTVANLDNSGLAKETTLQNVAKETTLQNVAKETTLQNVAKEVTLNEIKTNLNNLYSKHQFLPLESNKNYYFKTGSLFFAASNLIYSAYSDCVIKSNGGHFLGKGFFYKCNDKNNPPVLVGYPAFQQLSEIAEPLEYVGVMYGYFI